VIFASIESNESVQLEKLKTCAEETNLRACWNRKLSASAAAAPLVASQMLFRRQDRGQAWQELGLSVGALVAGFVAYNHAGLMWCIMPFSLSISSLLNSGYQKTESETLFVFHKLFSYVRSAKIVPHHALVQSP
jgi:hypothetical protein